MARFQPPTDAQVEEVLRRILSPQLKRAFFEGLNNPLWVTPLASRGIFDNPPEPQRMQDGLVRDVYWPEIGYLIRVAPDAPRAVVDVLLKITKSNNPWVRRGVFTVGSTIPADQAARLWPILRSWAPNGFGWRTDPREMVDLAVNLLRGGQDTVGKRFANILFRPGAVLDDYWYEDGLPRIIAALGKDSLSFVLPWLETYERSKDRFKDGLDITFMSRDAVRIKSDLHETVEQALIDAVRDLAIEEMPANPRKTSSSLLATGMILARKIALFALSAAMKECGDDDGQVNDMLAVAAELLFDNSSLIDACRIEYAELARSVASHSSDMLGRLSEFLEDSLKFDDPELRRWLSRDDPDGTTINGRVGDYNERQLHRWLSAIGFHALPEQLRTRLAELDNRFGIIDSPLKPEKSFMMWSGPNSAITQDEMSVMSPTELVTHLESWHDAGNGWGPEPSHEGQGRQLTALLTANPKSVTGVTDLPERLRPIYLRAILQGWEAALKADLELDWPQVVDVISRVMAHDDDSNFPAEGSRFHDDVNFRPAKKAAASLLEEIARQRASITVPTGEMSQFANMLITVANDEAVWSEYITYNGESGMDPLTVSLNWQWPIQLRGLVYLMSRGTDTNWYKAARSSLEIELAKDDKRGASRAVLGEGLARLLLTDPEWLERNFSSWFGGEDEITVNQQIALTTAISVNHYHPRLFDLLAPAMHAAIMSENPVASGWRMQFDPLQRIGEWIINSIMRAYKSLEDPIAISFFTLVPPEVRGEAIGHIAWSFMHAEVVDESIRDGLARLWDMRVEHVRSHPADHEELNGFEWFVKSNKFTVDWWLPRLKETAELDPLLGTKTHLISKEIASSADFDPRTALDVLELLLRSRDDTDIAGYALRRDAIPIVLAKAIISGDSDLLRDSLRFMNHLGEEGDHTLEEAVKAALAGISQQNRLDN